MMITGDYHHTAIAVAKDVGMVRPDAPMVIIDVVKHSPPQPNPQGQNLQEAGGPGQGLHPEGPEERPEHSLEAQMSMAQNLLGATCSWVFDGDDEKALVSEEEEAAGQLMVHADATESPVGLRQEGSAEVYQTGPVGLHQDNPAGLYQEGVSGPLQEGPQALSLESPNQQQLSSSLPRPKGSDVPKQTGERRSSSEQVGAAGNASLTTSPLAGNAMLGEKPAKSPRSTPKRVRLPPEASSPTPHSLTPPGHVYLHMPSAQHGSPSLELTLFAHHHDPHPPMDPPWSPPATPKPGLTGLRFIQARGNQDCEAATAIKALAEGQLQCAVTGDAFDHMLQLGEVSLLESVMRNAVVFARMKPHQKGQVMDLLGSTGIHQLCEEEPRHLQVRVPAISKWQVNDGFTT